MMTGTLKSTALIVLIVFSTIIGLYHFSLDGALNAKAAPSDVNLKEASISCISPKNTEESGFCAAMEAQILDVTIQIEMHLWQSFEGHQKRFVTKSYATILDGKYLVTHNHFKYSLRRQVGTFGEQGGYTEIALRTTTGNLLLEDTPLRSFRIVYEEPEMLVLAFIDENGIGLFEAAGLPSGQFTAMGSIPLEVGNELAQIDWDGQIAHVDWVRINKLSLNGKVPHLHVDNNHTKKGCSGGGVFWNGIHVGNTWGRTIIKDPETNEITQRYSIIVLNSSTMFEGVH